MNAIHAPHPHAHIDAAHAHVMGMATALMEHALKVHHVQEHVIQDLLMHHAIRLYAAVARKFQVAPQESAQTVRPNAVNIVIMP